MRESTFTQKIHKLLDPDIYVWKISDRFHAGVPDAWYSGPTRDAWVEYKFYQDLPSKFTPKLTPAQKQWLHNRYDENRLVLVIVGDPTKAVILQNLEWEKQVIAKQAVPHREIATQLSALLK